MSYLGTQPNDVKKNTGLYTPSEILQLEKDGNWGGSLELIAEQTADGSSATIDFLDIKEDVYDVHILTYNNVGTTGSDYDLILIRLYESGVLETASVYQWANQRIRANGGSNEYRSTVSSSLAPVNNGISSQTIEGINSYIYLYDLGNASKVSYLSWQTVEVPSYSEAQVFSANYGGGILPQASVVDGIRLYNTQATSSSSISSGSNFKLYGVKEL